MARTAEIDNDIVAFLDRVNVGFTPDIHWGSVATMFNCTDPEFSFYFLRFLLGVAEAGFFPGIILYLTC